MSGLGGDAVDRGAVDGSRGGVSGAQRVVGDPQVTEPGRAGTVAHEVADRAGGKVERFQQTMKKWLRAQPHQPATITELQTLLDTFREEYNNRRPHRSLEHRSTPATAYATRPKATPGGTQNTATHDRVRRDRISTSGTVTLRVAGRLRHIGIGRTYAGTYVYLLVQDLDVRVVDAATGELLRELTIDPRRDYQPTGRPPGPAPK